MKKILIQQARAMLADLLKRSGASDHDIQTMVMMRLEYEFHQNLFSGFDEIEKIIEELKASKDVAHEIVVDRPAMKLINGHGRSARLIGMDACELVSQMAKEQGIALVGIYNTTYHGILETYSRAIAAHDLIGVVSANGGPQGVVPFNGSKDIFGTNPISYGIPTDGFPIVFDGATAKYAYGTIRLAKEQHKQLPSESYISKDGKYTTDPNEAIAIVPFGEHKGYAINLLLEILTGSLVRGNMGMLQQKESELGSVFIAIDPSAFVPIDEFKSSASQLVKEIQSVKPIQEGREVRVPGYKGEMEKQRMIEEGVIEVDDTVWDKFERIYSHSMATLK